MDYRINFLVLEIEKLFLEYQELTISQIKEIFDKNKKDYSLNEINLAVNILMVDFGYGKIIRDDYWSKEPVYRYIVNEYLHDSSYTRHYYSFNVDDAENKKFLLISDTHIGNSEIENYKMLYNIYEYSLKQGVNKCFHMGDIFQGIIDKNWSEEDILKQFSLFDKFYPDFDEIKTYALIGNHDDYINGFFNKPLPLEFDLRQLTRYAHNFYVISNPFFDITFSNIKINFSHRVFANWCNNKKKITCLDQFYELNRYLVSGYNILISGHLHKGFICNNKFENKDQLLLGVPSTTNLNINGVVAYIIELNYNTLGIVSDMNITLLLCDNDNKISKGETIKWSFEEDNKVLKRIFN